MRNQFDPIYFAPQPKFGGGWICFKDSPSPPPAPDYTSAAKATQTSQMSDQYTPYGSQVYSASPTAPSGYASKISLTPTAEQTLGKQLNLSNNLADVTAGTLGNVQDTYNKPLDLSSVPDVADKAYSAITSRLDPQWAQRTGQTENQLVNQGLRPGMEGYDNAMRDFNSAKNDAYQQANLAAISTMPQTYQLATATRAQPFNELASLRTGAQIQNPQFSPTPGANYLGAAQATGAWDQAAYNQQIQSQNAMTGGLFGLGGALGQGAIMKYGLPFMGV